jgi:CDP-6-deoxy-D-xylo-4-hexulose-3-dehydrase
MKNNTLAIEKLVKKCLPKPTKFVEGTTYIPSSGKSFDEKEICALVSAALEFDTSITEGVITSQFEREFCRYLGIRFASFCNSGSSANLLAFMALTSPKLGHRALQVGDEVITSAVAFPTTIAPIIQFGCVPVYVDVAMSTYNPTPSQISKAITEKTKAIFLAHTLGNPLDMVEIREIADQNGLWLIGDSCDALGATYNGNHVSSFAHLSTYSFYPAHQMTTGEGGMVVTESPMLHSLVNSFRDWGRDCWCEPGKDDTCGRRFTHKNVGELPDCFDHKYTYTHVGYNLKSTDLQASIGLEQLKKLPTFIAKRRSNWSQMYNCFLDIGMDKYFILPSHHSNSNPSWFGFTLTVKPDAPFTRSEIVTFLESKKIGTRNLFAGNITKQPGFIGKGRIDDIIPKADIVMNSTFWIGVHPGITDEMGDYIVHTFQDFLRSR